MGGGNLFMCEPAPQVGEITNEKSSDENIDEIQDDD